eukprot:1184756-Prorocentrum_minimum.AAC.1
MDSRPSLTNVPIPLLVVACGLLCVTAHHKVDVSHNLHGHKESAPLYDRIDVPFQFELEFDS